MKPKLLNEGYKPTARPLSEERGYQGTGKPATSTERPLPPPPKNTVSSIVKPKE